MVYPLSSLVATEQVETGDLVMVDFDDDTKMLYFTKQSGKMIVADTPEDADLDSPLTNADAAGVPLPTVAAAPQMSKSKGESEDV